MNSDEAHCLHVFEKFCLANTFISILAEFEKLCKFAQIRPTNFAKFFPKLKEKLHSKDAQQFLSVYEKKVNNTTYQNGTICKNTKVLIIGCGPSGLRAAIECQLLGAKVIIIEKRDVFSRNNVLHIWPFVINDLRNLGAKRFYPKFCAGSINHIAISSLQNLLLKIALLLGVEVHAGIGFDKLVEPKVQKQQQQKFDNDSQHDEQLTNGNDLTDQNVPEKSSTSTSKSETSTTKTTGWKITCQLEDDSDLTKISKVENKEFDVIIGANGRQCNLPGFKRKALRAKLAIAITANFINKHTAAEARVNEISGVSFIFKQSFFEELYELTGIELENIVYYKDETHYFIMTVKKSSLLDKDVLKDDFQDTDELLHPNNVDKDALKSLILECVEYSTEGKLSNLEFALNYRGEPDMSLFDFTSMYASENASKIIERHGKRLLLLLAGDSLLEPFWPMGTGCARGFLSAIDAAWMIRNMAKGADPLDVISERESIFKLLAQTTHQNLHKNFENYSVDPRTRYVHINLACGKSYPPHILDLYDTGTNATAQVAVKAEATAQDKLNGNEAATASKKCKSPAASASPSTVRKELPQSSQPNNQPSAQTSNTNRFLVPSPSSAKLNRPRSLSPAAPLYMDTNIYMTRPQLSVEDLQAKPMPEKIEFLMDWIQNHIKCLGITFNGIHDCIVRGDALCGLIHLFRPDLIPQYPFPADVQEGIELMDAAAFRNQLAFDFLEKEYKIQCVRQLAENGIDSTLYSLNVPAIVDFLIEIYKVFRFESFKVDFQSGGGIEIEDSTTNPQWQQKKAFWKSQQDETENQPHPPQQQQPSIHRSVTMPSIDSKFKRGNKSSLRQQQRDLQKVPDRRSELAKAYFTAIEEPKSNKVPKKVATPGLAAADRNTNFDKSPERLKRFAEAEQTKNKALQLINAFNEQKQDERKVKKEAIKKAILSLEGKAGPSPKDEATSSNSVKEEDIKVNRAAIKKAIQSLEGKPGPSNSSSNRVTAEPLDPDLVVSSPANVSTLENDDFFNEYNLRLWRKSRPTIEDRRQVLETNLLESAGLKKKSNEAPAVSNTIAQIIASKLPPAAKISDNALSLMQQRFGNTNTKVDNTDSVPVKPQSSSHKSNEITKKARTPSPEPKSKVNDNRNLGLSLQKSKTSAAILSPPKKPLITASPSKSPSLPKKSLKVQQCEDLDEEAELEKELFQTTDATEAQRKAREKAAAKDRPKLNIQKKPENATEEFDEASLDALSPSDLNEIANWSGKYL